VEAAFAAFLDRRLAPRGRWFIPCFALLVGTSSAVLATALLALVARQPG